jgi:hypothetical protein
METRPWMPPQPCVAGLPQPCVAGPTVCSFDKMVHCYSETHCPNTLPTPRTSIYNALAYIYIYIFIYNSMYIYTYMYIYIYIYFEGVYSTTVIVAPGASELGLGAAALAPLCAHTPHGPLSSARSLFVRRRATWEAFARNWTSILDPKSSQAPLGSPRCPKWSSGVPREPNGGQSDVKESLL